MADVAFISTPGIISLTGNPVNFKVAGRNAFSGTSAKFAGTLNKSGAFVADNTITLTWGSKSITITAKATPTAYNHIATTATNADILAALLQFPYFVNDFIAQITGGLVAIAAREYGTGYNIVKTGTLLIDLVISVSGTNKTATEAYKIITKVESNGEFITEHALVADPDVAETYPAGWNSLAAGTGEIDVAGILQEESRGHFTIISKIT